MGCAIKAKVSLPWPARGFQVAGAPLFTGLCLAFQYHINKLSIMSSENHLNNSDKEVDEVDAALSDLEITLEGGKTSTILVRAEAGAWCLTCPLLTSHQARMLFFFPCIQPVLFPSSPFFFFFYFCSCWKKLTTVEQCRIQRPVIFFIKPVFFETQLGGFGGRGLQAMSSVKPAWSW